jgi:hypothetical protein
MKGDGFTAMRETIASRKATPAWPSRELILCKRP